MADPLKYPHPEALRLALTVLEREHRQLLKSLESLPGAESGDLISQASEQFQCAIALYRSALEAIERDYQHECDCFKSQVNGVGDEAWIAKAGVRVAALYRRGRDEST